MKKLLFIAVALFTGNVLLAQAKQERAIGSFSKIDVSNAVHVELSMGNQESVTVETEEELMGKVKTEVENSELKIYTEGKFCSEKGILVRVQAKNIAGIQLSGASFLEAKDQIKTDKMSIELNGASKVKLHLNTDMLNIQLSGASAAKISGESNKLKADVSGASSLKAEDLKVKEAGVEAEGAARVSVHVEEDLKASASGASTIKYNGDPKKKSVDVQGASHVSNSAGTETSRAKHSKE